MFFTYRQWDGENGELVYVIRGTGDPTSLAPAVRAIISEETPLLRLEAVATMEDLPGRGIGAASRYLWAYGGVYVNEIFLALVLAGAMSGEFNTTDLGVGGRISWQPTTLLGVEGEIDFYPGDLGERVAFSGSRVEGLFGVTVGPRLGRVRPFAKLRPGFLTFREAPEPIACILIFPPPLRCVLAGGRTLFALDVGGGVEWLSSGRTFVRVDAGDRVVRYPRPASGPATGHDFRFSVGGGVRWR